MLGGKLMQQQKVWKELSACVRKVDHTPFLLQNTGERINNSIRFLQPDIKILTFTGTEKLCVQNYFGKLRMVVVAKGS